MARRSSSANSYIDSGLPMSRSSMSEDIQTNQNHHLEQKEVSIGVERFMCNSFPALNSSAVEVRPDAFPLAPPTFDPVTCSSTYEKASATEATTLSNAKTHLIRMKHRNGRRGQAPRKPTTRSRLHSTPPDLRGGETQHSLNKQPTYGNTQPSQLPHDRLSYAFTRSGSCAPTRTTEYA
ncbi:uncharacterized protein LOC134183547 [Corticium candelabrum]|uniref:uncharacterized protein LOC134183547 n=1 Tax=Corticium candelabrum TaxID=121492 RepID=UPI002E25B38D|nr:uncharacterized protein LOC134183547 [Corticium candelabrum]XP_062507110.1 uncharacterized protein LOC134183547 [Corticium candelabrum]